MSARASCPDCGWSQHYRRPSRARQEAASHRCGPQAARSRRQQAAPVVPLPGRLAALLEAAADRASGQPTAGHAIAAAAAVLRADPAQREAAFTAWRYAEQYSPRPGGFDGLLRARYNAPAQIAGSLRAAGLHLAVAA